MATVRELINMVGFKIDKTQMTKAEQMVGAFKKKMVAFGKIMAASIVAIGVFAVKAAADMESLTAEFEVMLGSAEAASDMVQDLTQFAAKTPFQVKNLAETTRTLLQFGVAADDVMPTLNMLGDVAGKNSQRLTSLSFAFGKVNSQGRLTGLELKQMIIAGFNPLNIIMEQTGETMEQVRDRMSKGAISADEVANAFKVATSEGGMFYQNMQKQSQTFLGMISTMKDNITLALAEIGKKLLPTLTTVVGKITELFQGSLGDLLGSLIGFLEPILAQIIPLIDVVISNLTPFIERLVNILLPVLTEVLAIVIKLLDPLLQIVIAVLDPFLTLVEQIMPIVFDLLQIFDEMVNRVLVDLSPFMQEFAGLLSDVLRLVMPIFRIFMKFFLLFVRLKVIFDTAIVKILLKGLTMVMKILRPIIQLISMFLVPLFEKLELIMTNISDFLAQIIYDIAKGIISLMNKVFGLINGIIEKINEIPFIKQKLGTLEELDEDKILSEITGDTINNNSDNRTNNISINNQFDMSGGGGDPQQQRRIIDGAVRSSISIELKKILIDSEGI